MRSLIVCFAALSLAACQPGVIVAPVSVPSAPVASCVVSGTGTLQTALYGAEAAYNVPAHAYVTADSNKQLSPALKLRVKPLLQNAYSALKLARGAYCVGNAFGVNNQVAAVYSLAKQASALLPKAN